MIREFHNTEEGFRLAFENSKDAIFWADARTGLIINCNRAAEILLEKNKNEIIGLHQTKLHPPQNEDYYTYRFKRNILEGGFTNEGATVITKSGKIKYVQIYSSFTSIGEIPIVQGIFRDFSKPELFKINVIPSISYKEINEVVLFLMSWDDKSGPYLKSYFPKENDYPFSIERVGFQLYNSIVSIYGHSEITEAQGVLLNIENINRQGYIFFDAFPDEKARARQKDYMLGLIAPRINYFESIKIKEIFKHIFLRLKKGNNWDIKKYWRKAANILLSSESSIDYLMKEQL